MSLWNNVVMDKIESMLVNLTNYIWKKRREEEKKVVKKIKESN